MSFQYVPSLLRIPTVPNFTPPNGIWRGRGRDEGLFAMKTGYGWGNYAIVRDGNFCFRLKFDNYILTPVYSDINGYVYWEGNGYVYYTQTYGWVWCKMYPGYEPVENYEFDRDGRKYVWNGDEFYTLARPPSSPGNEVEMTPGGRIHDEEPKTMTALWPRWKAKSGEFGRYEGADGESGEKVLGLPRFSGGGETFVRSLNTDNGHYTYGRIHYASGKWVIGEIDSLGGWHEGSEPDPDGSVNFRFVKPEGSEAEGRDITVSLQDYVCGDETEAAFLGSVATWR